MNTILNEEDTYTMGSEEKLGFLGEVNMASAIIQGMLESNIYEKDQVMASDPLESARTRITDRLGIKTTFSNIEVVQWSSVLILAVKPQILPEVVEETAEHVDSDQLVISIAAGVPLENIEAVLGKGVPLIRVMPNTPALIQKGMSAIAGGTHAEEGHMALAKKIFGAIGETVELDEQKMDSVTAVSGSGPAYVFRLMEAMVKAGVSLGLEEAECRSLVIQTVLGAAHLAKESDKSIFSLRQMVTSPGGTTEAGLRVLESMDVEEIFTKTMKAAYNRSVELGKGTGDDS